MDHIVYGPKPDGTPLVHFYVYLVVRVATPFDIFDIFEDKADAEYICGLLNKERDFTYYYVQTRILAPKGIADKPRATPSQE